MKKALALTLLVASCAAPREAPVPPAATATLPSPSAASDAGGRLAFDAPAIDLRRIAAGTEIDVVADDRANEGLARVDLPRTSLRATAGARFEVESPELDGCGGAGVVR